MYRLQATELLSTQSQKTVSSTCFARSARRARSARDRAPDCCTEGLGGRAAFQTAHEKLFAVASRPCKTKEYTTKGAQVLSEEDHEIIMEELHARDMGDEDE